MSQIKTFTPTTARRAPAPETRRAADVFPSKASPGVSLRIGPALLRTWRRRRSEHAALRALLLASDHVLDDIGVSRDDLLTMLGGR